MSVPRTINYKSIDMAFFKTKKTTGNLVAIREKIIVTSAAADDYAKGLVKSLISTELDEGWVLVMHVSEGVEMEILAL